MLFKDCVHDGLGCVFRYGLRTLLIHVVRDFLAHLKNNFIINSIRHMKIPCLETFCIHDDLGNCLREIAWRHLLNTCLTRVSESSQYLKGVLSICLKFFQKRVMRTKLDIYVFITVVCCYAGIPLVFLDDKRGVLRYGHIIHVVTLTSTYTGISSTPVLI